MGRCRAGFSRTTFGRDSCCCCCWDCGCYCDCSDADVDCDHDHDCDFDYGGGYDRYFGGYGFVSSRLCHDFWTDGYGRGPVDSSGAGGYFYFDFYFHYVSAFDFDFYFCFRHCYADDAAVDPYSCSGFSHWFGFYLNY